MENIKTKKTKKSKFKLLSATVGVLGLAVILSACTNNFCSSTDYSHIMRAYEPGVLQFHDSDAGLTDARQLDGTSIYYVSKLNGTIEKINNAMVTANQFIPDMEYWTQIDLKTFDLAYTIYNDYTSANPDTANPQRPVAKASLDAKEASFIMERFGFVKFLGEYKTNDEGVKYIEEDLWSNFNKWTQELMVFMPDPSNPSQSLPQPAERCPTDIYKSTYSNDLSTYVNNNRSCITLTSDYYGHYLPDGAAPEGDNTVLIGEKSWGYAWGKGFLEGLIVWPVAALLEGLTNGFGAGGWGQIGAIIVTTIIIRTLLAAVTFWATNSQIRMQAIQPEIQKLQAKYPNSKENKKERERMAFEQQKLYKEHKVKMWMPIVQMVLQFPIFISVWGAMTGSAALSSDSIFGLRLSTTMNSILFSDQLWSGAWWTAAVLFLIMALTQVGSMLLPRLLTKIRNKKRVRLHGPLPEQQGQKMTNMMSVVMAVMIIFMGFVLPTAMAVYWIVGALFSAGTSLVTHFITLKVMDDMENGKHKSKAKSSQKIKATKIKK